MTFVWSEEAVERLKALHAQGLSGSELASRLGGGLTRSAIFGKLHRLGLTGGTGEAQPRVSRLAVYGATHGLADCGGANLSGANLSGAAHGTGPMKFNFARKTPPIKRASAEGKYQSPIPQGGPRLPSLNLSIIEIGPGQCRFIEGDDGLACGHRVAQGSSWCPAHHRVVFTEEAA